MDGKVAVMAEFYAIEGEPVTTLKTARFFDVWLDAVRYVLHRHGCVLEVYEVYCVVTFPEGTHKVEVLPRVGSARYTIYLPDGVEFMQVSQVDGISLLGFSKADLPVS